MSAPRWISASAEVLTVGLPFCVFKGLTGLVMVAHHQAVWAGAALLALAAIDIVFNVVNLLSLLAAHRRWTPTCLAQALWSLGHPRGHEIGLAIDVFVSFGLVAAMIATGALRLLPSWGATAWNVAVICNVLGAGVGRLFAAIKATRPRAY